MTNALAELRARVKPDDVVRAAREYDRLGPDRFFVEHGYGPSRTYELDLDGRRYPQLSSAYGFLSGSWPFGGVEAIWCFIALRRFVVTTGPAPPGRTPAS